MLQEEKESENEEEGEQSKSIGPSATAKAGLTLADDKDAPGSNKHAAGTLRSAPNCQCVQFTVLPFILFTSDFVLLSSSKQKAVGKIIKFGTNIDLSDPKRWIFFSTILLTLTALTNYPCFT